MGPIFYHILWGGTKIIHTPLKRQTNRQSGSATVRLYLLKVHCGIGMGIGTGTGTGMGRETYIKTGTTFTLI